MSGLFAAELQAGLYRRLAEDAALGDLVGAAIYDAPLERAPGEAEADFVTLGEATVRPNDTKTSRGSVHDFTVTAHSSRDGFDRVKRIAGAIFDCLSEAPVAVEGGRLVALRFLRASATRGPAPEKRRIGLRFRAVVEEV